jgi:hypothetical protein
VLPIALHHHIIPPVSLAAPLLVCVDDLEILAIATEYGAEAIAHGHPPMPYVCTLRYKAKNICYKAKNIRIISCGSPLFAPGGLLAEIIRYPSRFGLKLDGGGLKGPILLFTRTPDTVARQVGHRGRRSRRKRRSP